MTTIGNAIVLPLFRAFDANGDPLAGGKLYTWTTPAMIVKQPTYSDAACTVANANPVILDSAGQAMIYLRDGLSYTLNLTDADGVQQSGYPLDGIYPDRAVVALRDDLADTDSPANGDAMIGVLRVATGAYATTQHEVNQRTVNVLDYMTDADRVAILDHENTADVTYAFNAAREALWDNPDPAWFERIGIGKGGTIHVPHGYFRLKNFKIDQSNIRLIGEGTGSTVIYPADDAPCIILGGFAAGQAPWPIVHCEISNMAFMNKGSVASTDWVKYGPGENYEGMPKGRAMSPAIYIPHPETATENTPYGSINDWHILKNLMFGYFVCSILVDGNFNSCTLDRIETNACTVGFSMAGPWLQSNNFNHFLHCSFRHSLWIGLNIDGTYCPSYLYSNFFDHLNIEFCGNLEEASLPPYGGACGARIRNVKCSDFIDCYIENSGPGASPVNIWTKNSVYPVNGSNKTFGCSWEFTAASQVHVWVYDGNWTEYAIQSISEANQTVTTVNTPPDNATVYIYHQGDGGGCNLWFSGSACESINVIGGVFWQSQTSIRIDAVSSSVKIDGSWVYGLAGNGGAGYSSNYGAMVGLMVTSTVLHGSDIVLNNIECDLPYFPRSTVNDGAYMGSTYVRWLGMGNVPPVTCAATIPSSWVDLGEVIHCTEANAAMVTKGGRPGQVITIVNDAATNMTFFHAAKANGKFYVPWGQNLIVTPGCSSTWQLAPVIAGGDSSSVYYWQLLNYTVIPATSHVLVEKTDIGSLDVALAPTVRVDTTTDVTYTTIAGTGTLAGGTCVLYNGNGESGTAYNVTLTHNANAHTNANAIYCSTGSSIVLAPYQMVTLVRMPANPAVGGSTAYWYAKA